MYMGLWSALADVSCGQKEERGYETEKVVGCQESLYHVRCVCVQKPHY